MKVIFQRAAHDTFTLWLSRLCIRTNHISCLVSDVIKVHDISRTLDLTANVFVLFVYGEKLLLNHKMNKPFPWYVVLSLYSPSASKLSSKSLICPRLRLGQMFTFRTISQPRACITQYNIARKWFIHKILKLYRPLLCR